MTISTSRIGVGRQTRRSARNGESPPPALQGSIACNGHMILSGITRGAVWSFYVAGHNEGMLESCYHNVQRFLLGGAAHRPLRESSTVGSAPVSEKRVGLSRPWCRQGYGR